MLKNISKKGMLPDLLISISTEYDRNQDQKGILPVNPITGQLR